MSDGLRLSPRRPFHGQQTCQQEYPEGVGCSCLRPAWRWGRLCQWVLQSPRPKNVAYGSPCLLLRVARSLWLSLDVHFSPLSDLTRSHLAVILAPWFNTIMLVGFGAVSLFVFLYGSWLSKCSSEGSTLFLISEP